MTLTVHRIKPVEWAAPKSASNARTGWSTRRGVQLSIDDGAGRRGVGVAAPLPNYAPDELEAAIVAVHDLSFDRWEPTLDGVRAQLKRIDAALPSVRFAVETALLELTARTQGCGVLDLFGQVASEVYSAALVDTFDTMAAARAKAAGARTVKLKVGRPGLEKKEFDAVEAATRLMTVRLDANGTTDPDRFWALPIEFFEEPKHPVGTAVIAWDESIRRPDFEARLRLPNVVAIVLKPMVLGGILECLHLARRARRVGVEAIASHTFDGPVAHRANVRLAFVLGPTPFDHGLGGSLGYRITRAALGEAP